MAAMVSGVNAWPPCASGWTAAANVVSWSIAHAEADSCREHADVDQCGLNQFVLFDVSPDRANATIRCGEPTAIFSGIGFISLDRKKPFPDQIESTRQSRFDVVAVGRGVGGCHTG